MGGCSVYVLLSAFATHTSISLGCVHRGSGGRIRSGGGIRTGGSGLHMQYVDKVLAPTLAKCVTPDIEPKQKIRVQTNIAQILANKYCNAHPRTRNR